MSLHRRCSPVGHLIDPSALKLSDALGIEEAVGLILADALDAPPEELPGIARALRCASCRVTRWTPPS